MKLKISIAIVAVVLSSLAYATVKFHDADSIAKAKSRFCNYEIPNTVALITFGSMKQSGIAPWSLFGQISKNEIMLSAPCDKDFLKIIKKYGFFAINYIGSKHLKDVEHCGLTKGFEKFDQTSFHREKGINGLPLIKESPISIECKVDKVITLNDHRVLLIGKIINVRQRTGGDMDWLLHVGDKYFTAKAIGAKVLNSHR
jgi:flavin reductase (DIM6/NTAB) family NADH-FMN oxidoreductase RutF